MLKLHYSLFVFLLLIGLSGAHAQGKAKKKSKQEKKMERYEKQKQAIIDSNFVFITKKIVTPYVESNWSGGYLNIERKFVRIQELDWVNSSGTKTRLNERAAIQNYRVLSNPNTSDLLIQFNTQIRARRYDISITFSAVNKHELVMRSGNETVRYTGKFK